MPRKIRELKADLRRAGYQEVRRRGKGSHSWWQHPLVAEPVSMAGQDGDDAHPYQERAVRDALRRAREAEERRQ
jgi:predicted RNA binding protein YcfA (HicA-like mRNA interferase family)